MVTKNYIRILSLLPVILIAVFPVYAEQIEIVTEEFPPYSYSEGGKVTGIGTEIVEAILDDLKIKARIRIYPWARAYKMALNQKNVLIYTISRTRERENLFKWVGFVAPSSATLFSLQKRNDITIKALNEAKKYKIGALREDARTRYLRLNGFTRINEVANSTQNLKMLLVDRIDLWLEDELTAYYLMKRYGRDPDNFRKAYEFDFSNGAYIAFSKSTSNEIAERFKKSLQKINRNGTYMKIVDRYK